ncbi:hypothetical protein GCM10023213_39040 [Prosthecobacter algae]|uniref:Uncharacterized protein n=1 Tax=Prosthecobacter algae TaxID=1144682 RepID=A0ABP9PIL3_9BACT
MVAAVIATVAWLDTEEPDFREAALGIMDGGWKCLVPKQPLVEVLPAAGTKVDQLSDVLSSEPDRDKIDPVLDLIYFNYR